MTEKNLNTTEKKQFEKTARTEKKNKEKIKEINIFFGWLLFSNRHEELKHKLHRMSSTA